MNTVYLNGQFLPQDEAKISIMDRGFLFGDGVYEVIPVYGGNLFRFEPHIARLERSLLGIKLKIDLTLENWREILSQLLQHNSHFGTNQSIYLQVTRGPAAIRNHAFPKSISPTIFAFSMQLLTIPYEKLSQGMPAITLKDTRWEYCNIKSTSLLANVLLYQQALEENAAETILIRDGKAIEGATSNLFIVKNEIIKTPPLSRYILGGVTRDLVLELAAKHGLESQEVDISEAELFQADEVWITSSTREIYPITRIDQKPIKNGKPGPIWEKMINNYHNFIKQL